MHISKNRTMFKSQTAARADWLRRTAALAATAGMIALAMVLGQHAKLQAQTSKPKTANITGYYQFSFGDTLAILDEHGNIEGHVDVFQPQEKPKPVLSYNITAGSVSRNHLEFKTQELYGKHYHFSGTVERGAGKDPGDYDYLRLAGNLETITGNSATGKKKVDRQHIVFKSLPQDVAGS